MGEPKVGDSQPSWAATRLRVRVMQSDRIRRAAQGEGRGGGEGAEGGRRSTIPITVDIELDYWAVFVGLRPRAVTRPMRRQV